MSCLYMIKIASLLSFSPKRHFLMDANQNVLIVVFRELTGVNLCGGWMPSAHSGVCVCECV